MLRDVCTTLIDWCAKKQKLVSKDIPAEMKKKLCNLINHLMKCCAHENK